MINKYKFKYLKLKNLIGGSNIVLFDQILTTNMHTIQKNDTVSDVNNNITFYLMKHENYNNTNTQLYLTYFNLNNNDTDIINIEKQKHFFFKLYINDTNINAELKFVKKSNDFLYEDMINNFIIFCNKINCDTIILFDNSLIFSQNNLHSYSLFQYRIFENKESIYTKYEFYNYYEICSKNRSYLYEIKLLNWFKMFDILLSIIDNNDITLYKYVYIDIPIDYEYEYTSRYYSFYFNIYKNEYKKTNNNLNNTKLIDFLNFIRKFNNNNIINNCININICMISYVFNLILLLNSKNNDISLIESNNTILEIAPLLTISMIFSETTQKCTTLNYKRIVQH